MSKGYMFYDDEIANSDQRICQISFILTDFNLHQIGFTTSKAINPECEFGWYEAALHGISRTKVIGCPTFPEFCASTGFPELLEQYILVAHNAEKADLHHIRKTFDAYQMPLPNITYIDTLVMAKDFIRVQSLADVCHHYEIPFSEGPHHDSEYDAEKCFEAFRALAADGAKVEPSTWLPSEKTARSNRPSKQATGAGKREDDAAEHVHGNPNYTIKQVFQEFNALGAVVCSDTFQDITDFRIAVTGGHDRSTMKERVERAGGVFRQSAFKKADFVVVGHNASLSDLEKIKGYRRPIMHERELNLLLEKLGV